MTWKFWQRGSNENAPSGKLPRPRELPDAVGRYLVVQEKMDPDYVWKLKCVLKPRPPSRTSFDFRVFSSNSGKSVTNYDSLNDHGDLIICQGTFDRRSNEVLLHKGD